jgi:ABC-type branched-subunit amino acid transport system ATPase component
MADRALLSLREVFAGYGSGMVIQGLSFALARGERVGILGRNGAGKTTLMRTIMGLLPTKAGTICVDGEAVTTWPTHAIARSGLAYLPQGRELFAALSVEDNLRVAARAAHTQVARPEHAAGKGAAVAPGHRHEGSSARKSPVRSGLDLETIWELFAWMRSRRTELAGQLSGGQQQQLALARALIAKPRLLLLDEPFEGVQPSIVDETRQILRGVCTTHQIALMIAEQDVESVLGLCARVVLMERGMVVLDCPTELVQANPVVLEEYLGI